MPIIEIEVSQELYDALEKACNAPEHRQPRVNPANPKEVIVGPKWDSPEDLAEKALEPVFSQIAGPYMPDDPAVKTLIAQKEALDRQIAEQTKVVKRAALKAR